MSGKIPGPSYTRLSGAAVGQDVLVVQGTNGKVTTAGAGVMPYGVSLNKTTAADQEQSVGLSRGIYNLQLSGAATTNDDLVAAASGKVSKFTNQTRLAFTAANGTETFTATSHGFAAGDTIKFFTEGAGALPTGIVEGVQYYVGGISGNDFFLYDTQANAIAGGGTGKIAITGDGTAPMFITRSGTFNIVGKAIDTGVDGQWIGVDFDPQRVELG